MTTIVPSPPLATRQARALAAVTPHARAAVTQAGAADVAPLLVAVLAVAFIALVVRINSAIADLVSGLIRTAIAVGRMLLLIIVVTVAAAVVLIHP